MCVWFCVWVVHACGCECACFVFLCFECFKTSVFCYALVFRMFMCVCVFFFCLVILMSLSLLWVIEFVSECPQHERERERERDDDGPAWSGEHHEVEGGERVDEEHHSCVDTGQEDVMSTRHRRRGRSGAM